MNKSNKSHKFALFNSIFFLKNFNLKDGGRQEPSAWKQERLWHQVKISEFLFFRNVFCNARLF